MANPKEEKDLKHNIEELLENPDALQEQLTKTEQFAKKNRNLLFGGVGVVVAAIAGLLGWQWYTKDQDKKAQTELFPAVFYLEKDSANRALKGDGNATTIGLEKITDRYSGTASAELAHFYIGVTKLQEGKYDEAISHLQKFDADDKLVQARAFSLIGDAYMEKNNLGEAISHYKKAADHYPNPEFTPVYLFKLGLAHELNKDLSNAAMAYRTITTDFKEASDVVMAQKRLARVEYLINKGVKAE
jgi:predicted negative regulator of RcsB-dependent stress response